MSAPESPITPARVSERTPYRRWDRLRLEEWKRLVCEGRTPLDAWREVATHPEHGLSRFVRANPPETASPARLAVTFDRFLARVAAPELERTRNAAHVVLREAAVKGAKRVEALVDGEFGEGKVRVREDGTETVSIDAAAASVQLAAAKFALQAVGIGTSDKGSTNVAVAVDARSAVSVVMADRDAVHQLSSDPALHAAAIDLARRASPPSE